MPDFIPLRLIYSDPVSKYIDTSKIMVTFEKRIELFLTDPFNFQLRNHQLTGKLKKYRSINITGDWRALYSSNKIDKENVIIFEAIGTHSQLYK